MNDTGGVRGGEAVGDLRGDSGRSSRRMGPLEMRARSDSPGISSETI